jgi:hypothetical protein
MGHCRGLPIGGAVSSVLVPLAHRLQLTVSSLFFFFLFWQFLLDVMTLVSVH